MATKIFDINPTSWVKVATGSCMVDTAHHCRTAKVTTQQSGTPDSATLAYHTISSTDARVFSNGCAHSVWVMLEMKTERYDELILEGQSFYVVVTGDNLE